MLFRSVVLCGINSRFQLLSPCVRQVTHALLTRPPLSILKLRPKSLQRIYSVRLACVRHAASVHPEPGSNSHVKIVRLVRTQAWLLFCPFYFWFVCSEIFIRNDQILLLIALWNFQGCITVYLSRYFNYEPY